VVVPVVDPMVANPASVFILLSVEVAANRISNANASDDVAQNEVTYVPLSESAFVERSGNVEVAVVEVAMNVSAMTLPATESFWYGDVLPIPTLPALTPAVITANNALVKSFEALIPNPTPDGINPAYVEPTLFLNKRFAFAELDLSIVRPVGFVLYICSGVVGAFVPIPTLPALLIIKLVPVEDPTTN
jgi:hypothetical protein